MKNIHEPAVLKELTDRINKLTPDAQRLWGKMSVAQMMAHLSLALESNLGDTPVKQVFLGKIFGKIAKKSIVGDKPIKPGLPTAPSFAITEDKDFNTEKQKLVAMVNQLSKSDSTRTAKKPHPFFGKMTPQEWDTLNYKHLDHHLRQFGV